MRVASFDIGKRNFAFYIEEFDNFQLEKIKNLPKVNRYGADGLPSSDFSELLANVYLNGDKILYKNLDLTEGCKKDKYLDKKVYLNMNRVLNEHKTYFDTCDFIVIEQQMSFGSKHNTMALKLGQHCYSFFLFHYGESKELIEFPAYYKTQVLGAPKVKNTKSGRYAAMTKPERKKWAVERAVSILEERGDMETLDEIASEKKRDDLADVLIQAQSFKYLYFVEKMEL